jgi:hypothetical protein
MDIGTTNPPIGDTYFHAPGVASVRWDEEGSTVLVEWEGWADSDEFKTLLEAGLRALSAHSGSRWLADCRRQRTLKLADQEWGDRVWLPRAVAAGLKRFAVVLPTSSVATFNLEDRAGLFRENRLEVAYFATVKEARRWLAGSDGSAG